MKIKSLIRLSRKEIIHTVWVFHNPSKKRQMADVVQKVVYGDPHSQWNKKIISEYIPPKNEPTGRCGAPGGQSSAKLSRMGNWTKKILKKFVKTNNIFDRASAEGGIRAYQLANSYLQHCIFSCISLSWEMRPSENCARTLPDRFNRTSIRWK